MLPPLLVLLSLVAFFCTIAAATVPQRVPLWVPVLLITVILLILTYPK